MAPVRAAFRLTRRREAHCGGRLFFCRCQAATSEASTTSTGARCSPIGARSTRKWPRSSAPPAAVSTVGLAGNTHFLMREKNNAEIAELMRT